MGTHAAVEDAEVIRALFAAFACRDVEAALALFEQDCTFWPQGTAKRAGGCTVFGVAAGKPLEGEAMEVPVIWVFRLRAGRVLHAKVVATAEEALAEASGEAAARRSST